jgi:hypothetical protein
MSVGDHVSLLYPHEKYHSPSVKKRVIFVVIEGEEVTGVPTRPIMAFGRSSASTVAGVEVKTSAVSRQYTTNDGFIVLPSGP